MKHSTTSFKAFFVKPLHFIALLIVFSFFSSIQSKAQDAFMGYNYSTATYPLAWATSGTSTFNTGTAKEVVYNLSTTGSINSATVCATSSISNYQINGSAVYIEINLSSNSATSSITKLEMTGSGNNTTNTFKAAIIYCNKTSFSTAAGDIISATNADFPISSGAWSVISVTPPAGTKSIRIYRAYTYNSVAYGAGSTIRLASLATYVTLGCTAPVFSTQPTNNQSVCLNASANLGTVAASQSPTYQWFSNTSSSNTGGTSVGSTNGGNTATFNPPTSTEGTYYYYCVATNSGCTTASNAVTFTVNPATTINAQSTATANYSQNATGQTPLTVTAVGAALQHQWYSNATASNSGGVSVGSANGGQTASFTPPTTTLGTTYYYCVVTSTCSPLTVTSAVSGAIVVAAALSTPPTLTQATSPSVDAPFDITYPDNSGWRTAVTAVQVGGVNLSNTAYTFSAGKLTLNPANDIKLQTPGSKSILVIATGYNNAPVTQNITSGAVASLTITTQPTAPTNNGSVLATQPVITLYDKYNNIASTSTAIVTANVSGGTWVLGGTTAVAASNGTVTFSGLTAGTASLAALSGATITFSTSGATNVVSNAFNIPPYVVYAVGDFGTVATGSWTSTTIWKKWDGTSFAVTASAAPTATDNVWIVGGFTVTLPSAGTKTCKDVHVIDGQLTGGNVVKTPVGLTVNGSIIEVTTNGILGSNTGVTGGDDADALRIDIPAATTGTVTFTGTGGIANICRIINAGVGSTVVIDRDVIVNYHGSGNAGNAAGYHSSTNNTLTINAGKTLTFAPWSCYQISGSSTAVPTTTQTINISGTITFASGIPANRVTPITPSFSDGDAYMTLATAGTVTLNVNTGGILNLQGFYPNGNRQHTTTTNTVTINNNGVINFADTTDFQKLNTQIITGTGTTNVLSGATLRIGNASGISASAADGPIQTSVRNYNAGATYSYDGTVAQVLGDGFPSNGNLSINNPAGVSILNSITVGNTNVASNSSISVSTGVTLTAASSFTLKSDATGTASVTNSAGTIAGNITVERYVPSFGRRAYVLLSSPVTSTILNGWQEAGATVTGFGTHITQAGGAGTNGFDANAASNASIFTYNDNNASGSKWTALSSTTTAASLSPATGYLVFVRGDRAVNRPATGTNSNTTMRATGTLGQGTVSPALLSGANQYTLIANPYPCAIDWTLVNKGNLSSSFTVYDPNLGVFVSSTGTIKSPNVGNQQASFIQSGQAFFVQNDNTTNSHTIQFTEAAKTTTATTTTATTVFGSNKGGSQLNVNVYRSSNQQFADGAVVLYDDKYNADVNVKEDVQKFNNFNETVGLHRNNNVLSIEARPVLSKDTVFLNIQNFSKTDYRLVIDGTNFATNTLAFLEDKYTGSKQLIDLNNTNTYGFTVSTDVASYASDRFKITLTNSSATQVNDLVGTGMYVSMSPNPVADRLTIKFKISSSVKTTINVMNTLGQIVATKTLGNVSNGNIDIPMNTLPSGVYTVQLLNDNKLLSVQKVVKN